MHKLYETVTTYALVKLIEDNTKRKPVSTTSVLGLMITSLTAT